MPSYVVGDRLVYLGRPPQLELVTVVQVYHPAGQRFPVYFVDTGRVPVEQYRGGTRPTLPGFWIDGESLAPLPRFLRSSVRRVRR